MDKEETPAQVPVTIAAPYPAGASRPRWQAEVIVSRGFRNVEGIRDGEQEFHVACAFGSTSDEEEAFVARLYTRWCDRPPGNVIPVEQDQMLRKEDADPD